MLTMIDCEPRAEHSQSRAVWTAAQKGTHRQTVWHCSTRLPRKAQMNEAPERSELKAQHFAKTAVQPHGKFHVTSTVVKLIRALNTSPQREPESAVGARPTEQTLMEREVRREIRPAADARLLPSCGTESDTSPHSLRIAHLQITQQRMLYLLRRLVRRRARAFNRWEIRDARRSYTAVAESIRLD